MREYEKIKIMNRLSETIDLWHLMNENEKKKNKKKNIGSKMKLLSI